MTDSLQGSLAQFVAKTKEEIGGYSKSLKPSKDEEPLNKLSFGGETKQAPFMNKINDKGDISTVA